MSSATPLQQQVHVLYADHQGWLRGWLSRKLGNAFDGADLAHDTYVRILQSGRFPPQPQQSRAFLAQVANGLVVDLFRRRQLETAYLEALAQLPDNTAPSPEAQAIVLETLCRIDRALHKLPS
ncbi:MAG TPA: sigma factor, partial [Burkholderiaceae bacterium]